MGGTEELDHHTLVSQLILYKCQSVHDKEVKIILHYNIILLSLFIILLLSLTQSFVQASSDAESV